MLAANQRAVSLPLGQRGRLWHTTAWAGCARPCSPHSCCACAGWLPLASYPCLTSAGGCGLSPSQLGYEAPCGTACVFPPLHGLPCRGTAPFPDPHLNGEGVPPLVPTPPCAAEPVHPGLFIRGLRYPSTSAFSVSLLPAVKASDADAVKHSSRRTRAQASCFQNSWCNPVVFSIHVPKGKKTQGVQEPGQKGREQEVGNIFSPFFFFLLVEKANLGSRCEGMAEPGLQSPGGFGGSLCSAVCGYAAAPVLSQHCEPPHKGCGDGQEAHHYCQGFTSPLPWNSSPAFSWCFPVNHNMQGLI